MASVEGGLMPAVFVNHGGGPLPVLGDGGHYKSLAKWMKEFNSTFPKPTAILVVSAHWEEAQPAVNTAAEPALMYDYGGFPPEAYKLKYPGQGAPELGKDVLKKLREAGFTCTENSTRDWDHGVFIPLMLMYPDADIPIVELSILHGSDAATHIKMGKAIAELRQEGVFILGSGASYHNSGPMSDWRNGLNPDATHATRFDEYLIKACCESTGSKREQLLSAWLSEPDARGCHPTDDHLLPLMVVAGAAGDDAGSQIYTDAICGMKTSCFQFGGK